MNEVIAWIAIVCSVVTLMVTVGKDLFGGGRKLSDNFHRLERETEQKLQQQRNDFLMRSETNEDNQRVGMSAITSNIHALREGLLEFRAKMAEDYMRRDSYYKATDELKKDFKDRNDDLKLSMNTGFNAVYKRLDDITADMHVERPRTSHK